MSKFISFEEYMKLRESHDAVVISNPPVIGVLDDRVVEPTVDESKKKKMDGMGEEDMDKKPCKPCPCDDSDSSEDEDMDTSSDSDEEDTEGEEDMPDKDKEDVSFMKKKMKSGKKNMCKKCNESEESIINGVVADSMMSKILEESLNLYNRMSK